MEEYKPLKEWLTTEKPREKLLKYGEHRLSKVELLAILIRSGTKGESAIDLARKILNKFGSFRNMSNTGIREWKKIKGIGEAKICQIKAAIEIGRRFMEEEIEEEKVKITTPQEVVKYIMPRMRDLKKEVFKILHLDAKNRIIKVEEITEGTVNQANPIIREIFTKALENFTVSIICIHNHPSGDPTPSREDREFTKKLFESGNVLGIKVFDHIIIGNNSFFSFAKELDTF